MDQSELMSKVDELLDKSKTAVMATVDSNGQPHMRWMTPGILRERPNSLFCLTSPKSCDIMEVDKPSKVSWMIQNKQLTEIVNLKGDVYKVNNPSLKAEVIEHVVKKLVVYWRTAETPTEFCVLETVFHRGTYFRPMDNVREFIEFTE